MLIISWRKEVAPKPDRKVKKLNSDDLFVLIDEALVDNNYYFTKHASERAIQRKNINELQVVRILKDSSSRFHEARKDTFDTNHECWNYSIRGKSVDLESVRIIISFEEGMIIVTVINLDIST